MENRERWARLTSSIVRLLEESREALAQWGFGDDALRALADADVAEVNIPFGEMDEDDEDRWEARIFPWEFMLTAATRRLRHKRSLIVVRHLDRASPAGAVSSGTAPERFAIIEAAPGPLSEEFDFSRERDLISSSFGVKPVNASNPSTIEVKEFMRDHSPQVLHFTAVDTRLAVELLSVCGFFEESRSRATPKGRKKAAPELPSKEWQYDGIVLKGTARNPVDVVPAKELAPLLTAGSPAPSIVGLNLWYSAGRIAPLTIAGGAQTVLGFQSTFDDGLAELFFANFYHACRSRQWTDTLAAFEAAWSSLENWPESRTGTGVVLWSSASLLTGRGAPPPRAAGTTRVPERVTSEEQLLAADEARSRIEVTVKPIQRLNYSLLHNNRPLFEEFRIRKYVDGTLRDVQVQVQLHVGADSYPFVKTLHLDQPLQDLAPAIRLPLTSALARRVDENMQTSLHARITCGDVVLYEDTHRITLLPIDLWKDSDDDRQWLPSFVLPRDPGVTQVIQQAQELLACLADDVTVGFDGYQSFDPEAGDPGQGVDLQVRAIWTALVLKLPLSYINPPPSYETESQRLRTPSQVLASGRGTCIDLALLLAACLEFVEIYPVIFLLEGHAFPGYWRSEEGYEQFLDVSITADETARGVSVGTRERIPWMVGRGGYSEVMEHVRRGNLVPIESTLLASKEGFRQAIEAGHENLRSRREFHSLLDVRLARDNESNPVTPLPIGGSA